jgi:hypothetical protein
VYIREKVPKTWKNSPEFQNDKIERKIQWPLKDFFGIIEENIIVLLFVEENFSSLDKWLFWIIFLIEASFMK